MRENKNLVKHLRALLETEVSQAEVMMAAKEFATELQEMVEKIGRLQNEDLPPVTDQMRETYGHDSASTFQTQIYSALQGVMDSLYTAKNQIDDSVGNLATTGQIGAVNDMDADMGAAGGDAGDMGAAGGEEPDLDLDNIGDELSGGDMGDEFGGEEEEPLGRSMKTEALQRKVMAMKTLVEKAKKLKEARVDELSPSTMGSYLDKSSGAAAKSAASPRTTDKDSVKYPTKAQTTNLGATRGFGNSRARGKMMKAGEPNDNVSNRGISFQGVAHNQRAVEGRQSPK